MARFRPEMAKKIEKLSSRLSKLSIEIKLGTSYPWVYIHEINGRHVTETFWSDHGFTIAFLTTTHWLDLKKMFRVIRKYV